MIHFTVRDDHDFECEITPDDALASFEWEDEHILPWLDETSALWVDEAAP